jgi:hypothetical protein
VVVKKHVLAVVLGVGPICLPACSGSEGGGGAEPASELQQGRDQVPSWEEFKARFASQSRIVDGSVVYIIEGDLPLDEAGLEGYYDSLYVEPVEKSTLGLKHNGTDNIWPSPGRYELTYCVSTAFGSNYQRAKDEVSRAVQDWMNVTGVRFEYVSSADSSCTDANSAVEIPVRPTSEIDGACAFFPDQDGNPHCTSAGRALVLNYAYMDGVGWYTLGIVRHELGHVLGLRHEHIRSGSSNPDCQESGYRNLTEYDVSSVMHYPWCLGNSVSGTIITVRDGLGIKKVYGEAPAILAAAY